MINSISRGINLFTQYDQFTKLASNPDLRFIFSRLAGVTITHGWSGRCAGTRDLFPHVGLNPQGMHYALGYCFSGNAMGPYLARKAAARILNRHDEAQTLFDNGRFPTLPLPARNRWTMPLLLNYYAWADRPKGLTRAKTQLLPRATARLVTSPRWQYKLVANGASPI